MCKHVVHITIVNFHMNIVYRRNIMNRKKITLCNVFVLHSSPAALFVSCNFFLLHIVHADLFPDVYPGPPQISKMESFTTIIDKTVNIVTKLSILDILRGPGYVSTISMLHFFNVALSMLHSFHVALF